MQDLGPRNEFHSHTIFSDGKLLPLALVIEAQFRKVLVIALTDHVDPSNIDWTLKHIVGFVKQIDNKLPIKVIPGAEVSYLPPKMIGEYCKKAKKLGARLIIVHGESPVEPAVPKGTNQAALKLKGLVNILAHPGWITEAQAQLAKDNDIYLELSARRGHSQGNKHVAKVAKKVGAKLLVNTDAHADKDLIAQEHAFWIAKKAGLNN